MSVIADSYHMASVPKGAPPRPEITVLASAPGADLHALRAQGRAEKPGSRSGCRR